MNNREQLKKLIEAHVAAMSVIGGDCIAVGIAAAKSGKALDEFIDSLNLDPVLETYEQAAKREGWLMDERHAFNHLYQHPKHKDYYANDWQALCEIEGIERQIIDKSKEPSQ